MKKQTITPLLISILLLVVQGRIVIKDEIGGVNNEIDRGDSIHPGEKGSESEDIQACQQIKGLPEPASGCCGVQFMEPSNQPSRSRFRRSSDSDILPSKMINHGRATDIHGLPWTVYLYRKPNSPGLNKHRGSCGGSIISSRFVLTAAHCVDKYRNVSLQALLRLEVILGEYDTSTFPRDCISEDKCIENKKLAVDRVIIHPDYNSTNLRNDIALVKLSSDIPYTEYIRPICLPTSDIEDMSENTLVIAGWGGDGNIQSNLKQAAVVNYVTNEDCKEAYSYKDGSMSCLRGENGEDVCSGDSGGPVMVYSGDKYFLAGVVNGKRETEQCGSSVPSLFNNVYYHKNWILREVNNESK